MYVGSVPDAFNRVENLPFGVITNKSSLVYDVRYRGSGNSRQLRDLFYSNSAHSRRYPLYRPEELEIMASSIVLNAFTRSEERNQIMARRFYSNFLCHSPSKLRYPLVFRVCLDQFVSIERGFIATVSQTKPVTETSLSLGDAAPAAGRNVSVDVYRGLVMLLLMAEVLQLSRVA